MGRQSERQTGINKKSFRNWTNNFPGNFCLLPVVSCAKKFPSCLLLSGFCKIALQIYREISKKYRKRKKKNPAIFTNLRKAILDILIRNDTPMLVTSRLDGVAKIETINTHTYSKQSNMLPNR